MWGYVTRYMRLQDRAVVTVSKPRQRADQVYTMCRAEDILGAHSRARTFILMEKALLKTSVLIPLCLPLVYIRLG